MPPGFKRVVAIFGIFLFLFDTGSDTYVGIDLFGRCHDGYGSSVISFFCLPGVLIGFLGVLVILDTREFNLAGSVCCAVLLGTLLGPILFIPASLYFLVKGAIDVDDLDDTYHAKL